MTRDEDIKRQDPTEKLDYTVDWTRDLGEETIAASAWNVPPDITKSSAASATPYTSIVLEGGKLGKQYPIVNRITTSGGRKLKKTFYLKIVTK